MASVYNRGSKDRPVWWCRIKVGPKKWVSRPTGAATKGAALTLAEEKQRRADRGENIDEGAPVTSRKPAHRLTVEELADRFLEEYHRGRIKDMDRYRVAVRIDFNTLIKPHLGAMPAAEVRRHHVGAWVQKLLGEGYTPRSVNRALARLSSFYTWADTMEVLICRNPVARFERLQVAQVDEHLTLEQVHKLLRLEDCPVMVQTALYTAMRKGELFGLRWPCVRFDLGAIEVKHNYERTPKNGKPRVIPLHPELAPILRAWRERCPKTELELVFPVPGLITEAGRRRPAWRMGGAVEMAELPAAFKAAGLDVPKMHPWHVLRHTTATLLLEAGAARDAVEMILGHRSSGSATTSGYLHAGLPYLAREMAKLTLRPPAPAGVVDLGEKRRKRAAGR